jgi:hypothetical protein
MQPLPCTKQLSHASGAEVLVKMAEQFQEPSALLDGGVAKTELGIRPWGERLLTPD